MKILIRWIGCFFNCHRWAVSKSVGLDRKVCTGCGRKEFRYDPA